VVNNSPTIADAGTDAEVCGESAILFANSPAVGTGYWEVISGKGDFTDSLNFNTTINGLIFGENTLRWTTRNGECVSDDDIVITNNLASVYAGEDMIVYEPVAALTGNNHEGGNGEWLLVAGNGSISEPDNFMTTVNNLGAGVNTFEWTITLGSCVARDQVMVSYKVMPKIGFIPDRTEGCPGLTVAFANTTQYGTTYLWDLGDGIISDKVNVTHTYDYPGSFVVRLTAFGPDNREVSSDTIITVHRPPVADFQFAPDTAFVNKPMRCYDYSYGASVYTWDFGDNQTSPEVNPMHYYENSGEYIITLTVASAEGCTDTVSAVIYVAEDGNIIFPNAFTPDPGGPSGGIYSENDRSNDVFHPYHENIADYRLEIYSRWGILLFESTDVNIGWDGYYNGKLLAKDVYVWKATGRYVSGSEFFKTGNVLLIK
jgi:gliding motility-associated-like protein